MTDTQAGSTVPRRQLGRLTARAAARELERSEPTLWRIENGHTATRSLDVDVVPEWLDLYIGLEAAATRIDWYESELVPGLFQTGDYARTLIREHAPDKSDSEIDRRVELRLARQAILRRPVDPPLLRVALREPMLRCPVGGAKVMTAQLDRLAEASELSNVSLRVVPVAVGLYSGLLSGPFEILRFPANGNGEESEPPTVYTDTLYLDKPHEVNRYDQAFEKTWKIALDDETSRALIRKSAEELR